MQAEQVERGPGRWCGVGVMRFALEALRQVLAWRPSINPATLLAGGGVAIAALVVVYGAFLGADEIPEDAVTVSGPVFTPVATTAAVPAPTPAAKPSTSSGYAAPRFDDEMSVTRAVQAELKSAECYSGPINGVWTGATRAAMGRFTARVNARLPVDRPDPVLLALLETHNTVSCTADCIEDECAPTPTRRSEVASIDRERASSAREEPLPSETSGRTRGSAEDLGFDSEDQRAPNPIATMQTASTEREEGIGVEDAAAMTAAGAAAGAATHEVTKQKPRRTARKRKKNTFARSVSKGFRQIQRSLNKLF